DEDLEIYSPFPECLLPCLVFKRLACPFVGSNKGFACADVISRYDCRYYVDCRENQICCRNQCSYQCYDPILKEFVSQEVVHLLNLP
ncbi:hypothetical protein Anas_12664, partial [Armadillidium nasatum]